MSLRLGDLFDVLPTLEAESIDACVTDPPYGLGFMAKDWDVPGGIGDFPMRRTVAQDAVNTGNSRQGGRQRSCEGFQRRQARDARAFEADSERWAAEVLRVLKPSAHLLVFGGTRTFHRLTAGIEDAGFEIRDCLTWLYGSGFPKSLNVGGGWGTALKPAWEPIILARKPTRGTVAANRETFGTGAINIEGCRIGTSKQVPASMPKTGNVRGVDTAYGDYPARTVNGDGQDPNVGRWPANLVLDEDAAAMLDEQAPTTGAAGAKCSAGQPYGFKDGRTSLRDDNWGEPLDDLAGASRFFYCAKPSREERNLGCDSLPASTIGVWGGAEDDLTPGRGRSIPQGNHHPTVKPLALMRWLVRLVTPTGGLVLDPFTGSGTTGMACAAEGLRFLGIEREAEYIAIAERRIASIAPLFSDEVSA